MSHLLPRLPATDPSSRRTFLREAGGGLGMLALAWLIEEQHRSAQGTETAANPHAPRPPHFPAHADQVIFLFMHGGPSHLETFDPKPELQRLAGKPLA